jgi:ketosteroid isomerase-like protein
MPRRARRLLIGVGGVVVLAGGGYAVYSEMQRAERDRHAVIQQVEELQHLIRRHDGQLFMRFSVAPDADAAHADRDALLQDFERLSHVDGFQITNLDVVVTGDSAVARYEASGRAVPSDLGGRSDQAASPLTGEITVVRHGGRWEVVSHRFVR